LFAPVGLALPNDIGILPSIQLSQPVKPSKSTIPKIQYSSEAFGNAKPTELCLLGLVLSFDGVFFGLPSLYLTY